MDAFKLSNVVPQCVIDFVTDYEPANINIVRGSKLVATWRDTRAEAWNTQNVYLFNTVSISDAIAVGALHLPEWSVDRSPFALCLIVNNEIVEVRWIGKDVLLAEVNFSHDMPLAMVARFSQECIVQPRGKLSKFQPVVEWFTLSHFALIEMPVTYCGPTTEPEHEGIPAEDVEEKPRTKYTLRRLLGDDDYEPDDPDYSEDEDDDSADSSDCDSSEDEPAERPPLKR